MLFLAGALVLAACGSGNGGPEPPPPPEPNTNPEADAGDDQTVDVGDTVTLDGSDSSDAEGAVTYSWTLTPARADVALSSSTAAQPTFTAPTVTEEVELVFTLTVTDTASATDTDTVTITVNAPPPPAADPPEAEAGDNQTVAAGATVTLNGTGSTGEGLEYAWTGPSGITLSDASVASPTFAAPAVTANAEYVFTLTVTDDNDATATDTVTITVTAPVIDDEPPTLQSIAYAEDSAPTGTLSEGDEIRLVATFSGAVLVRGVPRLRFLVGGEERFAVPAEGEGTGEGSATLTFVYVVQADDDLQGSVEIPDNPLVLDTEAGVAIVSADDPDVAVDENIPADDIEVSEKLKDEVMVEPANVAPTATVIGGGSQNTGETITLNGSTSSDTDGDIDSYRWTQQSPPTPIIALTGAETAMVTLVVPAVGDDTDFVFRLEVTDDDGATATADVTVSVSGTRPVANAGTDRPVRPGALVALNGSGSRPTGDDPIVAYEWTQLSPAEPLIAFVDSSAINAAFVVPPDTVAPEGTIFVFQLEVTSNNGFTHTDTVSVTVSSTALIAIAAATGFTGQEAASGTVVTLDGSGSATGATATISTYQWTQESPTEPAIQLANGNTVMATFTAPAVATDIDFVFRLDVTDSDGQSGVDRVTVTVPNTAPRAIVGDTRSENTGTEVMLDGSMSTDEGGMITAYSWTQQSPAEPAIQLANGNTATATFTAPAVEADTPFVFQLEVTDNGGDDVLTNTAQVQITVPGTKPTAVSVSGGNVTSGEEVTLDGSQSNVGGGATITTYTWTQQQQGTEPTVAITDLDNEGRSTFTVPADAAEGAQFAFQLVVVSSTGLESDPLPVSFTVSNTAPDIVVSRTPADERVNPDTVVMLDGTGTQASPGRTIATYSWTQLSPEEPTISLDNDDTATASFTAPRYTQDNSFRFQLMVVDSGGESGTGVVAITINAPPIIPEIENLFPNEGDTVTLDGSGSSDPGGGTVGVAWTQQSPAEQVTLTEVTAGDPAIVTFTAPSDIDTDVVYTFVFTATDEENAASTREVTVTANAPPTAAIARPEPGARANSGEPLTLDGTTSTDPSNNTLTYMWALTAPPELAAGNVEFTEVTEGDGSIVTYTPSSEAGDIDITFQLTVTDEHGAMDTSDTVTVTVNAAPSAITNGDQEVDEGAPVTLDGSGSREVTSGDASTISTYVWAGQDAASSITLTDITDPPNGSIVTFNAPDDIDVDTEYTFRLTVTDVDGLSSNSDVTITVNALPTATITNVTQNAMSGVEVTLDGSSSSDGAGTGADGSPSVIKTYLWAQQSPEPPAEQVVLTDISAPPNGSIVTFTAPDAAEETVYTFVLTVTDDDGGQGTGTATVTVAASQKPIVTANSDASTVAPGGTVTLTGTASDPEGGDVTTAWRQTAGIGVPLQGGDTLTASFTVPTGILATAFTFELVATDRAGAIGTAPVSITVTGGADTHQADNHVGAVYSISISDDGNRAVSGGRDGTVRLWNAAAGTEETFDGGRSLGSHAGPVYAVAISGDGRRAISGGEDGTLRLWNTDQTDTGQYGNEIMYDSGPGMRPLAQDGAGIWIYAVALNADGTRAVSGGLDGQVRLWNTSGATIPAVTDVSAEATPGTEITFDDGSGGTRSLGSHFFFDNMGTPGTFDDDVTYPVSVYGVAISDDGSRVLSGGADGKVRLLNTTNGTEPVGFDVPAGSGPIFAVDLVSRNNDNGTTTAFAVAGSADNKVYRWNAITSVLEGSFNVDTADVTSVTMNANIDRVLSSDGNGFMRLHQNDGTVVRLGEPAMDAAVRLHTDYVWSAALSANGAIAASAGNDGLVNFWATNIKPADTSAAFTRKPTVLEIVPTGAGANWAGDDLSSQTFNEPSGRIRVMNLSADGSLLVSGDSSGQIRSFNVGAVTTSVTDIERMNHGNNQAVWGTALSADGSILASGGHDDRVRFWNTADGTRLRADGTTHNNNVLRVALTPDGRTALSGGEDDRVVTWDTTTNTNPDRAGAPTAGGVVTGVALSASGLVAVTGSTDNAMTVWTRTTVADPFAQRATGATMTDDAEDLIGITEVALSADGSIAVSGSKDHETEGSLNETTSYLRVWNVTDGSLARRMERHHANEVLSIDLGSDGRLAISGSRDQTARLWDVATGKLLRTMRGHGGDVSAVSMSGDGRILSSGTSTQNVHVWRIGRGHAATPPTVTAVATSDGGGSATSDTAVTLDGSSSSGAVAYRWRQTGGLDMALSDVPDDPTKATATFTPPSGLLNFPSTLTFELTVTGEDGLTVKVPVSMTLRGDRDFVSLDDHDGSVYGISLSNDGTRAASAGKDGTVRLWNTLTATEITFDSGRSLGRHDGPVYAVAISGNGERVLSGGLDGELRLWNTATGDEITFGTGENIRSLAEDGAGLWIYAVALNTNGNLAVSGGFDGKVRLWNTATGDEVTFGTGENTRILGGHETTNGGSTYPVSVYAVDISDTGDRALSGGADGKVRLWNTTNGNQVHELTVPSVTLGPVLAVDLNSDGTRAAAGSAANRVDRWNAEDGTHMHEITGGATDVTGVAVNADGSRVLSVDGGTLRLRMGDGASVHAVRLHTDDLWSVALSSDGGIAASAGNDGRVSFWSTSTTPSDVGAYTSTTQQIVPGTNWDGGDDILSQELTDHSGPVNSVSLSRDGLKLASASGTDGAANTILLHDVDTTTTSLATGTGTMQHPDKIFSVALNADGRILASGSESENIENNLVRFWDTATRRQLHSAGGQFFGTRSVTQSPDGSLALSAGSGNTLVGAPLAWDTNTGTFINHYLQRGGFFDGDGTQGGENTGVFPPLRTVSLSANGLVAVAGGENPAVGRWTRASRENLFTHHRTFTMVDAATPIDSTTDSITSTALSADGSIAVSGSTDHRVRVWNTAATGEDDPFLRRMDDHTDEVSSVALSTDGRIAISGSLDDTVRLWDVATGALLRTMTNHGNDVNSVSMSGDARIAASGDSGNNVRVWRIGREYAPREATSIAVAAVVAATGTVTAGNTFTLDGSTSTNAAGYTWRQTRGPDVTLNRVAGDPSKATFEAPTETLAVTNTLVFELSVTDAIGLVSATRPTVEVTMTGERAVFSTQFRDGRGEIPVHSVSLSADGSLAVTGSLDGQVRLWNPHTGTEITFDDERSLGRHDDPVYAVAMSGDGTRAISGGADGTIRLWNTDQTDSNDDTNGVYGGEITYSSDRSLAEDGAGIWVYALAMNNDGTRAVSGGFDGQVRLWNTETTGTGAGTMLRSLGSHTATDGSIMYPVSVYAVDINDAGTRALSGGADGTVRLWNTTDGSEIRQLSVSGETLGPIFAVDLNSVGTRAAAGSAANRVDFWNADTGTHMHQVMGPEADVTGVAMTADTNRVLSADGGTLRLRSNDDTATDANAREVRLHTDAVWSVALSDNGAVAASAGNDGRVNFWGTAADPQATNISGDYESTVLEIVPTGSGRNWDDDDISSAETPERAHVGNIHSVAMSADGTRAASVGNHFGNSRNHINLYEVTATTTKNISENQMRHGNSRHDTVNSLALNADGSILASANLNNSVRFFNTTNNAELSTGNTADDVTAVTLSPDGNIALSGGGGGDGDAIVWDPNTGTSLPNPGEAGGNIRGASMRADGLLAVTGGDDDRLTVWTRNSYTATFTKRDSNGTLTDAAETITDVTSVALSADGSIAISGSKDRGTANTTTPYLRVWDVTNGTVLRSLPRHHTDEVTGVDMSNDGRIAISGSKDNTMRLWNVATGELLRSLKGHTRPVVAVSMNGDGRMAVSGASVDGGTGSDHKVRIWRIGRGHSGLARSTAVAVAGDGTGGTTALAGQVVTLDGSGSQGETFYQWRQTGGPSVELSPVTGEPSKFTFTVPSAAGTLGLSVTFELTVMDANGRVGTKASWAVEVEGDAALVSDAGDGTPVHSIAITDDGTRAVSGGRDGRVRLWDATTGNEITFAGGSMDSLGRHDGSVYVVAISGNGRRAISGSHDGRVQLWNADNGTEVTFGGRSLAESGAGIWIYGLALNHEGTRAVSSGLDGTLRLWNLVTGDEITFGPEESKRSLGRHTVTVIVDDKGTPSDTSDDVTSTYPVSIYSVDISNNGNRVLSGGADGTVRLWNAENGTELSQLSTPGDAILGPVFAVDLISTSDSDESARAVASSAANRVDIWDVADDGTGRHVQAITGDPADVTGVAITRDGSRVLSADGGTVRLRESDGSLVHEARLHTDTVWAVALSGGGTIAASAGNDGRIYFWGTREAPTSLPDTQPYKSSLLEIVPEDTTTPENVNWHGDDVVNRELDDGPVGRIRAVAISGDGRRIASGGHGVVLRDEFDNVDNTNANRIWIHDLAPATMTVTRPGVLSMQHLGTVRSVALNANGTVLVSGGEDNLVRFWNPDPTDRINGNGNPLHATGGDTHTENVLDVTVSPSGAFALSGGEDDLVIPWNVATGASVGNPAMSTGNVEAVSISLNGLLAVTGGSDHQLTVWERPTLADGFTKRATNGTLTDADLEIRNVTRVALSADGSIAISGSHDDGASSATTPYLRVWNVTDGTLVTPRVERAHTAVVTGLGMSLNGRVAISSSLDGTVRLWDVTTGKLLRTMTAHSAGVENASINSDGRFAVSGDRSGNVRVWRFGRGHSPAREIANADMVTTNPSGDLTTPVDGTAGPVTVTLDGSLSSDGTYYNWEQTDGPDVTLDSVDDDPKSVTFIANVNGTNEWTFRYTVVAIDGSFATKEVSVVVQGQAPRADQKFDDPIRSVAISDDGTVAVSGGDDGVVRLWDMTTREEIRFGEDDDSLGNHTHGDHTYPVYAVAISGDGTRAISATFNGHVRVWNTDADDATDDADKVYGEEITYGTENNSLFSPLVQEQLERHMVVVHDVALNTDGTRAVLAGFDGTVRYFDTTATTTGGSEILFGTPTDDHLYGDGTGRSIYAVDIVDTTVVFGDSDGNVRKVTIDETNSTTTPTPTLLGTHGGGAVHSVSLNVDGTRALTGGADNRVFYWDTEDENEAWQGYHVRDVTGVSLGANRAVSVGEDGALYVWNVNDASGGQGGRFLALIDDRAVTDVARECSLDDPDACPWYTDHAYSIALAPTATSNHNVITGSLDGTVRFLNLGSLPSSTLSASTNVALSLYPDIVAEPSSGSSTEEILLNATLNGATVSSAIQVVLSVSGEEATAGTTNDFTAVSDVTFTIAANATSSGTRYNGDIKISLPVHSDSVTEEDERVKVTATLTGGLSATSVGYITIKGTRYPSDVAPPTVLTDVEGAAAARPNPTHKTNVSAVAISHDGTKAFSGSNDGELIFWNTQTADKEWRLIGEPGFSRPLHNMRITGVDLSADGSKAVSADENTDPGEMIFWDNTANPNERTDIFSTVSLGQALISFGDVSIDADGSTVATLLRGQNNIYVFEAKEPIIKFDTQNRQAGRPLFVGLSESGNRVMVGTVTHHLVGYEIPDDCTKASCFDTNPNLTRYLGSREDTPNTIGANNNLIPSSIAISGDGRYGAIGNTTTNSAGETSGKSSIVPEGAGWSGNAAPTGSNHRRALWTSVETDHVNEVALTRHGRLLANASNDGDVNLYLGVTRTARLLRELTYVTYNEAGDAQKVNVASLDITPDGRFIVSAHGKTVLFWALGRRPHLPPPAAEEE